MPEVEVVQNWQFIPTYRQIKIDKSFSYRARQLYKNISMLFLFPVKDVSLVQASMQHLLYHVTVSLQQSKITLQNNLYK